MSAPVEYQRNRLTAYRRADGTIVKYRLKAGNRKAPSRRLLRQWQLLRCLAVQHTGVTVSQLSRVFRVNRESIRHDVATLEAAGFGIRKTVDRAADNSTLITLVGCCRWRCDDDA